MYAKVWQLVQGSVMVAYSCGVRDCPCTWAGYKIRDPMGTWEGVGCYCAYYMYATVYEVLERFLAHISALHKHI